MSKKFSCILVFAVIITLALSTASFLLSYSTKGEGGNATSSLDKEGVRLVVKDFINENPELIIESIQQMQARKEKEGEENARKVLSEKKNEIEDRTISPIAGNPKGDVTIVEFFDYSCGYCKRAAPTITQLLEQDKNVVVVFKELPILGAASEKAAQVALGVYALDKTKYVEIHNLLMASTGLTSEEAIIAKAVEIGIDANALKSAMEKPEVAAEIKQNRELASLIGVHGTPAFVINGELIAGAADLETLKETIAAARKNLEKNSAK